MGKETATKPSSAKTPGKQKSTSRHTASPEAANSQGLHLALSNPLSASSEQIAQLQRQYGNRAVQRLIQRAQARVQREAAIGLEGGEVSANEVGGDLQSQINSAQGGGQPLDKTVGSQIGSALGSDFSNVHVHTDAQSDSLNRSLSATAFTTGSDIFFSQGAYNPGTHSGKQLLTHELTHVVQQGGGAPTALKANKVQTKLTVGPAGDKYEEEADQVASQVMRMPARQAGLRLQRHVVSAAIQRKIMDVDEFKTATSTRRRGGYIKDVDKVLGRYHANPTPATLTALRFALEKYLATKGDGSDEKATQARQLLAQVMEEEQTLSPKDQMEGLLPYKNDIVAMAAKGKLLKKLDAKLTGANKYVREDLKKAIIESPKTPEVLEAKVAAINLDGGKDPIVKLAKELSKGSNPGKAAIYHSLYARCVEMASTAFGEHEAYQDFAESMKDTPELKDLVKPIIDVTRIFAEAFDLSYHKKKTQQRDMAQAEVTGSGGTPLNVVVMGAGPVGMIAAMEAHLAGANVHVYEMRRTTPNRANVLKLTDPTMHKLRRIGVYSDLFGPDNPRGEDSLARGHGISVGLLEDVLRTKAAQMGIRVTYGYELETITAPDEEGGKTRVRLKKYVPTRSGPEMDLYEKLKDQPDYLDATSDLVIGATGAGGSTRAKLGLESERR